ncbi:MaoC family dehydratase [Paenibacillus sp. EC2-1]|uniref:MaoC family dehydratase n=1 Tax=Paenibacillus sp. EC2-1 TaxID=3388665 RepID=UPI003BEEE4F1
MKKRISFESIQQYASASKDAADIHLDAEAAACAGFKRPIAHGMYIMGLAQSLYIQAHPEQWITSYELRFSNPLYVESEVEFEFEVAADYILVKVTGEDGEMIASGTMSVKERQS